MGKGKQNKSKKSRPKQSDQTKANDQTLRRSGLDLKKWTQNSVLQPIIRLNTGVEGYDLLYVFTSNANGRCQRLYRYDPSADEYVVQGSLIDEGFTLWGDFAEQWDANAFLYELYRSDNVSQSFAPATLAGYGSQAGGMMIEDPTGVLCAEVIEGINLAGTFMKGISDVKNVKVLQSFKTMRQHQDYRNLLLAEQQQQMLMTKDPEDPLLARQEYQTGQVALPPGQTRNYLPALVGLFRFDVANASEFDRDVVLGTIKWSCQQTFAQRRTQWEDPDGRMTQDYKLKLCSSLMRHAVILAPSTDSGGDPQTDRRRKMKAVVPMKNLMPSSASRPSIRATHQY